jgi:hypothetical protein
MADEYPPKNGIYIYIYIYICCIDVCMYMADEYPPKSRMSLQLFESNVTSRMPLRLRICTEYCVTMGSASRVECEQTAAPLYLACFRLLLASSANKLGTRAPMLASALVISWTAQIHPLSPFSLSLSLLSPLSPFLSLSPTLSPLLSLCTLSLSFSLSL